MVETLPRGQSVDSFASKNLKDDPVELKTTSDEIIRFLYKCESLQEIPSCLIHLLFTSEELKSQVCY